VSTLFLLSATGAFPLNIYRVLHLHPAFLQTIQHVKALLLEEQV
jgi:hypothetical protein